jgi:hypothetical protein
MSSVVGMRIMLRRGLFLPTLLLIHVEAVLRYFYIDAVRGAAVFFVGRGLAS